MARPNNLKKLEADIPSELHDELNDWISHHKDVKMRQCARAMIEMFLSLPEDLQAKLLICKRGSLAFNSAYRFLNDGDQTKTIELSSVAQEILREFDGFVESDIINAALISFYKCTLAERMECLNGGIGLFDKAKYDAGITRKDIDAELKGYHAVKANKQEDALDKKTSEPTVSECIQIVSQYVRYHIPSEDEARLIQSLRKELGSESDASKRKQKKDSGRHAKSG